MNLSATKIEIILEYRFEFRNKMHNFALLLNIYAR